MSEALPLAIDRIRPSVVQIRLDYDNDDAQIVGTGFIVHSEGYALTARHVTQGATRESLHHGGRLTAGLALPNLGGRIRIAGSFEIVGCEIVEEDPRHDLALVRLVPTPFQAGKASGVSTTTDGGMAINALFGLAQLRLERPRDGVGVAVSGYPLATSTLITTSGAMASSWGVDLAEVQPPGAPEGFTISDMKDSYIADVAVNPGNSGGPVYLSTSGEVVGVCVALESLTARTMRVCRSDTTPAYR